MCKARYLLDDNRGDLNEDNSDPRYVMDAVYYDEELLETSVHNDLKENNSCFDTPLGILVDSLTDAKHADTMTCDPFTFVHLFPSQFSPPTLPQSRRSFLSFHFLC